MTVNAVDCTGLSPAQIASLVKNGVKTVGRYLSHSTWKGLTMGEAANLKAAGLQIFSIYESNPTSASYFSAARGKSDALDAMNLAKCVDQPEGTAIYFTVDYDARSCDLEAILAYFQAVKANLKGYKVGAYGSFTVLNYLHENRAADYWFQTIAWSGGQRCSFLNIYQFQEDKTYAGVNVDFDNLEKDDIGAWPVPVAPPIVQASVTPPTATAPAVTQVGVVTVKENTVIRTGPDASYPIVKATLVNDQWNCYGWETGWYNCGGGWINCNYVTFSK